MNHEPVQWYRVVLSYAVYGVGVDAFGVVVDTAPIAQWMVGRHWPECQEWVVRKGGRAHVMK